MEEAEIVAHTPCREVSQFKRNQRFGDIRLMVLQVPWKNFL